jgi:hypothetical protein
LLGVVFVVELLKPKKEKRRSKIAIKLVFELIKLVRRDWFVISVCEGMGNFKSYCWKNTAGDGEFIRVRG